MSKGAKLNNKKIVKVHSGHDIQLDLSEDGHHVTSYNITGIYDLVHDTHAHLNQTNPLVSIKVHIDSNGIVSIPLAECIFDEMATVNYTEAVKQNVEEKFEVPKS